MAVLWPIQGQPPLGLTLPQLDTTPAPAPFRAPPCRLQALGQFWSGVANAEAAPFIPNFFEISRRMLRRAAESVSAGQPA